MKFLDDAFLGMDIDLAGTVAYEVRSGKVEGEIETMQRLQCGRHRSIGHLAPPLLDPRSDPEMNVLAPRHPGDELPPDNLDLCTRRRLISVDHVPIVAVRELASDSKAPQTDR